MKPHFESFNSNYMAGCQQPFLSKLAGDNRLSAAVFGPKRLVTTGCQQPSPFFFLHSASHRQDENLTQINVYKGILTNMDISSL